jgi:hypothetical protein
MKGVVPFFATPSKKYQLALMGESVKGVPAKISLALKFRSSSALLAAVVLPTISPAGLA